MQIFRRVKSERTIEATEQALYLYGRHGVYKLLLFDIPLETPSLYGRIVRSMENTNQAISSLIITNESIKLLAIFKGKTIEDVSESSQNYKAVLLARAEGIKAEMGYQIISFLPRTQLFSLQKQVENTRIRKEQGMKSQIILIKDFKEVTKLQAFLEDALVLGGELRVTQVILEEQEKFGVMILFSLNKDEQERLQRVHELLQDYPEVECVIIGQGKKTYEANLSLGISPFLLTAREDMFKALIRQLLSIPRLIRTHQRERIPFPMAETIEQGEKGSQENQENKKDQKRDFEDVTIMKKIKEHIISNLLNEGYEVVTQANGKFDFIMKRGKIRLAFDFIDTITEERIKEYSKKRVESGDKNIQVVLIYKNDETDNLEVSPDNSIAFLHYKQILDKIKE